MRVRWRISETAALREDSQRVKHHVFLERCSRERCTDAYVEGGGEKAQLGVGRGREVNKERKWNCQKQTLR